MNHRNEIANPAPICDVRVWWGAGQNGRTLHANPPSAAVA